MIERQLEAWLTASVSKPQVIQIVGLRQTGKTTLMENFRKRFRDGLFYPLQDLVVLRKYEAHPELWALEVEHALEKAAVAGQRLPLHVFVDEIQKIPALFQAIQGLYDRHKGRIKFWIWGSSARPLKKHRAETLAGRILSKTLWPLSQAELMSHSSHVPFLFEPDRLAGHLEVSEPRGYVERLKRWFNQTLLPEPVLMEDSSQAHELLQSYQATYLENEIRRENLTNDIGIFEQFLTMAAAESGHIVNYSSKANVLGVSSNTVKTYFGILSDTFCLKELPAYSQSVRVQISKSPKTYFTDAGFARFLSGERGVPAESTPAFGGLVEGFVVNEIFKQIEYGSLPWKTFYFRTKTGMEADLVLARGTEKIACEIKAARKITPADLKGIKTLMELDAKVKHGVVFSLQPLPIKVEKNIYNFPIWNL